MNADALSSFVGGEMSVVPRIPHFLSHDLTSYYNIFVLLGIYYYNTLVFVNNFFVSDNGCKEVTMKRIEEARSMRGWSQAKLAEVIGTSQQQVARFEKPGADVKSSVLLSLSDALDVSISWLLGITDDPHGVAAADSDALSPDEWYLIHSFRSCTPKYQAMLLDTAASYRNSSKVFDTNSASYIQAVNE